MEYCINLVQEKQDITKYFDKSYALANIFLDECAELSVQSMENDLLCI
jgi:hypothetical protein